MTEVNADQHEFKDDVDRFMDHIHKAINLRVEAQRTPVRPLGGGPGFNELRKESEKMIRDAEYMVYQLIDNAKETR